MIAPIPIINPKVPPEVIANKGIYIKFLVYIAVTTPVNPPMAPPINPPIMNPVLNEAAECPVFPVILLIFLSILF